MAAASSVITFGLLHMRPLQWWHRTTGFSPRGKPFCRIKVTQWCLRALDMWKKLWFLSQGPVLGAPCHRVTLMTDASLTGWGVVMWSVGRFPSHVAHQVPWDAGCISNFETLSPRPERPSCASAHRQYVGGLLHQPPGGSVFAPPVQSARSSSGPRGNCSRWWQCTSLGTSIREQTSCRDSGWGPGNSCSTPRRWSRFVWSLRLVWWEHFYTPGRDMSPRLHQLFHSQSFFRHSVHLPFGMLSRKSLIVCVQCKHLRYLVLFPGGENVPG